MPLLLICRFHVHPILGKGSIMRKGLKTIPQFKNEAEEQKFWDAQDSSAFVDWYKAERVRLPNLKPTKILRSPKNSTTPLNRR
jgi:hypothetical protein